MQTFPAAYKIISDGLSKQPVYVFEIIWAGGGHGSEGTNDIYFTTCDVNEILNFPYPNRWFPFLDAESISGISQSVDPINGVSTIGELSVSITDFFNKVSDIIKAADNAGHGLRRQLCEVYVLFKGMDWADRVKVRTMQIHELKLVNYNQYKLTCADVQRRLQKTVFNPYTTKLTAAIVTTGAITPAVYDSRNFLATTQQVYGLSGFIKIDDEIMRWTVNTGTVFTIGAPDRGMFGSIAAVHDINAEVHEIIVMRENPITMALKIMQSMGTGANGAWDVYPARWGCGMSGSDVDVDEWLEVGKLLTGLSETPASGDGVQFEFVLADGIECKRFIEDQILKILGSFGFVHGDGKYGIRAYSDLSNAAKENASFIADQNSVVKWGELSYNYGELTNQVWIEYDEPVKLSGKYIRNTLFIDNVSIKKWGEARQLKYAAAGIIPTSAFASQLYQRFQRIGARYSRPPMQIALTMLPKFHGVEIGDVGRVTLPIRDLLTGATLDRAFEVISTQLTPKTGEVVLKCLAQPERAQFWFGGVGEVNSVTISPASASTVTGQTQQFTARALDGLGNQIPIPAISWIASGNVTVDANGLVTAGAVGSGTVFALVGSKKSNLATITVLAVANVNAVASVVVSPSTVTLEAPQTQQLTAQALDVAGNHVQGKTFTWLSSNPAAASVPAGPTVSAVVTAVANGSTNITATETVSAIASANVPVTVATPATPDARPPVLMDSAYQIGTQITAHGPVGGPHVIPDGYDFPSGDYWYDGDVSLAIGTTCTINGTVRLFSLGKVTIDGTVDGSGRGPAGQLGWSGPNIQPGRPGVTKGFVGNGGTGGRVTTSFGGGQGAAAIYAVKPILSLFPNTKTGESWDDVVGLPKVLTGSQAGSGAVSLTSPLSTSGDGGASGAGLLIMARGFYLTSGLINLNGLPGANASVDTFEPYYEAENNGGGGGGGGGGGSFVKLIEANNYGLPTEALDINRINTFGGIGGLGFDYSQMRDYTYDGYAGQPGTIIEQVVG